MSKLNWEKSNTASKAVNYVLDNPEYSNFKPTRKGSDSHITNLAKKCYNKMIKDPKNLNIKPEYIWEKSLVWAKKVAK